MSLPHEYADVFDTKPGLCKVGMHEVHVMPDYKPKCMRAYRIPELLKPEVARQIQELLDLGFIDNLTFRWQVLLCVCLKVD